MSLRTCFIVSTAIMVSGFFLGCGSSGDSINCVKTSAADLSLKWDPTTTYENGSPLTNLKGYNIYYGAAANNLIESVNVGPNTSYVMSLSAPGRWYFAVTAYSLSDAESAHSNIVCVDAF